MKPFRNIPTSQQQYAESILVLPRWQGGRILWWEKGPICGCRRGRRHIMWEFLLTALHAGIPTTLEYAMFRYSVKYTHLDVFIFWQPSESFFNSYVLRHHPPKVPDLDASTTSSSRPNSPDADGIFAFADEERGVTVAIFNFLMILFGLSQMQVSSGRKAITAG